MIDNEVMMPNFSVSPMGLTFPKVKVQGPIPGLYASAPTQTFTLKNTSGASVTITNFGFSTSTEGDAVTQPAGILGNSDFLVIPTGGIFPVTVANNAIQSFTVTYSPLRRGSGFGDVRSVILALFSGSKALTNGGQVLNSVGEVIDEQVPIPVTVGVGGGVIEEGFDWPSVHPMFWTAGVATPGIAGVKNNVQGMSPVSTLADMDTGAHYGPMMFWQIGSEPSASGSPATSTTTPRAPSVGAGGYGIGTAGSPATNLLYTQPIPYDYGTPRGGRSYQILVFFRTPLGVTGQTGLGFDLTIKVNTASPVVVATFPGVNYTNVGSLFVGNAEGLDLQGIPLIAEASNFTVNGTVWSSGADEYFNVGAVITG
jgi:hypothetical protein